MVEKLKISLNFHGISANHGCEAIVRETASILGENLEIWSTAPEEDRQYGLGECADIHDALYFNMTGQTSEDPQMYCFSDDVSHTVYNSSTGMYTAAQFAAYMGFSEIYLIGVDHHFQISRNNKGEIVVDNSVKDYFSDKYNQDKSQLYIPNTEKSTLTYIAMKKHCDQSRIKVYNATRGGKLEVFQRVDFDTLF